jgi:hypothetical protein
MADKDTGAPVHFDCVIARLTESEQLEKGDVVAYLGGGRFGVVHFNILPGFQGKQADGKSFTIKKVFEWENKENRAEWRSFVSDHYSVT